MVAKTQTLLQKGVSNTLWHVDPFLGNDREISDNTTAVAK
jgi:hypothetical protein